MKVPLFEFIQKMSQALSSSFQVLIWEGKLDYLKTLSGFQKLFLSMVTYEFLAMFWTKVCNLSLYVAAAVDDVILRGNKKRHFHRKERWPFLGSLFEPKFVI